MELKKIDEKLKCIEPGMEWVDACAIFAEITELAESLPVTERVGAWTKIAYDLLAMGNDQKRSDEIN